MIIIWYLMAFLKKNVKKNNLRLYQLGKLHKYITCDLANTVYKQTIIPIFDYADILIESGQNKYVTRLNDLHVKGVRIIDCNKHAHATDTVLEKEYGLLTPTVRRHKHHSLFPKDRQQFGCCELCYDHISETMLDRL